MYGLRNLLQWRFFHWTVERVCGPCYWSGPWYQCFVHSSGEEVVCLQCKRCSHYSNLWPLQRVWPTLAANFCPWRIQTLCEGTILTPFFWAECLQSTDKTLVCNTQESNCYVVESLYCDGLLTWLGVTSECLIFAMQSSWPMRRLSNDTSHSLGEESLSQWDQFSNKP